MRPRLLVYGGALLVALCLAAVSFTWQTCATGEAWILLDPPEKIVSDRGPRGEVQSTFRLRNGYHLPLRILGGSMC